MCNKFYKPFAFLRRIRECERLFESKSADPNLFAHGKVCLLEALFCLAVCCSNQQLLSSHAMFLFLERKPESIFLFHLDLTKNSCEEFRKDYRTPFVGDTKTFVIFFQAMKFDIYKERSLLLLSSLDRDLLPVCL